MTRAHRPLLAKLAIALLLFMRLAVAAYACPGMAPVVEMQAAHDCCPTLDPAQPNLCLEHGRDASQAHGPGGAPLPLADLPLLAVLPAPFDPLPATPAAPAPPAAFLAHGTAPPPAIVFGAFRS